jgi:hypothetical protein
MLLQFPKRTRHGRASRGSAACSIGARANQSVIICAVRPAPATRSLARIADQYSAGILSRCDHLETAQVPTPSSEAIAPRDGQSSTTDRNEVSSDMDALLGQSVLKSKAILSRDCGETVNQNYAMAERLSETEEKLAFIRRVRLARVARFDKQGPILTLLDLPQGKYKQYESRTPLPWRFIPKFCAATGVSMEWLLTGEGEGPKLENFPKETQKRPQRRMRAKAA